MCEKNQEAKKFEKKFRKPEKILKKLGSQKPIKKIPKFF